MRLKALVCALTFVCVCLCVCTRLLQKKKKGDIKMTKTQEEYVS